MPRENNIRNMSDAAIRVLIEQDLCPACLGELDTGWECNDCDFDARPIAAKLFHLEVQ